MKRSATAILTLAALACGGDEARPSLDTATVAVTSLRAVVLHEKIEATGELIARQHAKIAGEVEGRITQVVVREGSQVAAGTGSGAVVFGQLVHREVSCGHLEVRQEEPHCVTVINVNDDTKEDLQFKDRVTEMSLTAEKLVVLTATQACIYSTANWNTPHIIELRGTVSLIMQVGRGVSRRLIRATLD